MHLIKSNCKINKIHGMIVSYLYTGTDVEILEEYPIVSLLTVKEAIKQSTNISELYDFCQKSEKRYASVPVVKEDIIEEYANMKFKITKTVLNPEFEKKANNYILKQVRKSIEKGYALKSVEYKELNLNDIMDEN